MKPVNGVIKAAVKKTEALLEQAVTLECSSSSVFLPVGFHSIHLMHLTRTYTWLCEADSFKGEEYPMTNCIAHSNEVDNAVGVRKAFSWSRTWVAHVGVFRKKIYGGSCIDEIPDKKFARTSEL